METKEEFLKIYSSYLPYELQIRYKDFPNEKIIRKATLSGVSNTEIETTYKRKIKGCAGDIISWHGNNNIFDLDVKPLLFSMDYLTKEIEHKGESFVPYKKLGWGNGTQVIPLILSKVISYNEFENLLEWHFNVFNLSDSEFIKKETLNK